MLRLGQFYYCPIHKWKLGEVQAYASIGDLLSDRVIPLFVIPPVSEYDYDQLQTVTLVEHLKQFGTRLKTNRGDKPVLIDASLLDTPELREDIGSHPLTALLERARQNHAYACPVVGLTNTAEYLHAARAFLARNDHIGFGVRLRLSELDNPGWIKGVEDLVASLNQRPQKGVLILDAGPLFAWDDGLVDIVIDRLNHMPFLNEWAAVFFSSTSFPEKRPTPVGETGRFERSDRSLFRAVIARHLELIRSPRFSDYALEYPSKFRQGGGTPKAHLRYSSESDYLVAEGPTTKGNGFAAIYDVGRDLVSHDEFRGPGYSAGNLFMHGLSQDIGPGNPSKWRWAATDHHLTLVVTEQSQLFGFSIIPEPALAEAQQELLPGIAG